MTHHQSYRTQPVATATTGRRPVRFGLGKVLRAAAVLLGLASAAVAQTERTNQGFADTTPYTVLVPASPDAGFHFPYFLKLPTVLTAKQPIRLVVETNNTGAVSDDFPVHLKAARRSTEQGVGASTANRLELPLLIPVFPRPSSDENLYTHALDTDALNLTSGPLQRLDLQLVAMIDDALRRLRAQGIDADEQVLLAGFSASASFANRFSLIHPQRVAALAIGGFNAILMLPTERIGDVELLYPLGIADFEQRFGHPFERERWLAIPQFAFMGENDTNDAVQFDDAYSQDDRLKVHAVLGEAMAARWQFVQHAYREAGANLRATTYPQIGHETNGTVNKDMAEFLGQANQH